MYIGVQAGYNRSVVMWKVAMTGALPDFLLNVSTYKSGSLAVQDMLNGNIKYVIIDAAPANAITASINAMQ